MSDGGAARVRRRFLLLSATRWLPTGLLIPVAVVLAQERGLSLATIGVLAAVQSSVMLLLELPTGGLADALGRRPVLLFAAVLSLLSTGLLVVADTLWLFVLVKALDGVSRALESGPLDSWYVDAAQKADAHADIERGLAAKGLTLSVALGAGALLGGALALVPDPLGLPPLGLPVLASLVLRVGDVAALHVLLTEVRPAAGVRVAAASVRRAGTTVREALRLMRGSRALLALPLVEGFWGAGMMGVELLSAPRMVDLLGDVDAGVGAIAVASAVAWSISGAGAAAAPWVARLTGSWVRAAIVTRVTQAGAVAMAAVIAGPAGLLAGYLGFYLVHGAANVAHYGLVHRNVGPRHRATIVSANSLTSRLGGTLAAPLLGAVAAGAGIPAAFAASAVLLLLPAPLYLWTRPPAPAPGTDQEPARVAA